MSETVEIRSGDTRARIALDGAEPVSWQVAGRECLWGGDPAHWNRHAPWLFPVVGASAEGQVTVAGRAYPMGQHGFARDSRFTLVEQGPDHVRLRLEESEATLARYPFRFRLEITARLRPGELALACEVANPGEEPLPYALGFHPAFPWPFAGGARRAGGGYAVQFERAETPAVPEVGPGGLLRRERRPVPLDGDLLALDPETFTEALVFLAARSRWMRFVAPSGAAIRLEAEDFPHLAVWTRPSAPFLSLECWTGHADWVGFSGELAERDSQRLLAPGAQARHGVVLAFEPG
ncbi:Aldose 1-epimerase [Methylobacterium sp. 4-46]|uniref:aldose 1-epimerase family protein n=1 Tax=unclassified Methylobacterium TaxID=2615210 RepID=UPI000152C3C3|nr:MULTISPECIES: aldose 1-epimerase family protein [Methylobacterium]ACA17594.1 Aldose 1-epimerase [Methylobacterium sp. 4-46]WFT83270.1 aldose 1-epimerase family protein [Methylobacterium nodulans]